ncbi:O-acetyl-ADP-ribose deacetylase (regulator of RNase III), contains Macro domain [Pseudobutyrivibrio sp. C4]|uniref:macro domain-containing protein n=1 Tax=Pseudobutyrivibrio sp. C4 TaxID=1520803 RepID=UPI0008C88F28|nr:macro domain-containing protein [Pseudobutyrivibrio sp. C4]SES91540.1 O-acetyl-ADP-ribose deacetylase (regulator of RNase III), contains Macro domain [Pseudobutyrivibrio sp. C4]
MPFQIIRNDITKVKADAIVNTANPYVNIGSGVDSAIYEAAGREQLLAARDKIGILNPGEAAITSAFNLDAKYIIHVSSPWWEGGNKGEAELLRSCYDKTLKLAKDNNCKSIAFPLLATGSYDFPKKLGLEIAVNAFTDFLEENEMEITLVVFEKSTVYISGELGEEVRSYIDDLYVEGAIQKEYGRDNYLHTPEINLKMPDFLTPIKGALEDADACEIEESEELEDILGDIYTDTFGKHLQKLINKKGLKNSQVYVAANISKQYFSKLLKGQVKPSKEKVLALAVGLRLNMDEAEDFLRLAGYAFSPISQTDTVVAYFLKKQEFSVAMIDIVLFDYGLDTLSKE